MEALDALLTVFLPRACSIPRPPPSSVKCCLRLPCVLRIMVSCGLTGF